jgi:hypothetical protein
MRRKSVLLAAVIGGAFSVLAAGESASAQNLLANGDLDVTYSQEINPPAPGFFLPKPAVWVNDATKGGGPWEDEMSSEPWAGPAPTPVTANGVDPDGPGGNPGDWAVFFKPFSGSAAQPVTGHLYQDVPGIPGVTYKLTGWAGAEANALFADAVFAIDFLNGGGGVIGSSSLSLPPTLFIANGEPFQYKPYTVSGVAPLGTAFVRARASMIDAQANPLGGGQAFVVDDFVLTPEPGSLAMIGFGAVALLARRRKA